VPETKSSSLYGLILCDQMLSVVVWSQSTVSSSRAAKPSVPFGGGTENRKLVCDWLFAPLLCSYKLQFAEGTKPQLCIVEWNSPMPVYRWFSLTKDGLRKGHSQWWRARRRKCVEVRGIFLPFCIPLMIHPQSCSGIGLSRSFSSFSTAGTNGCLDLNSCCCAVGVNKSLSS